MDTTMHAEPNASAGTSLKNLLLDPIGEEGSSTAVDWDTVSSRLRTHPHEAASYEYGCVSPLQYALSKCVVPPPAAVVRHFLESHPKGAEGVDGDGSTALYYAVYYGQSSDVVQVVLEFNHDAARVRNVYGMIPLHVARTLSVARKLLEAYPEGLAVRSNWSSLPLHYAASMAETEPDVVRLFVEEGVEMGIGGPEGMGGLFSVGSSGKLPHERVCEQITDNSRREKNGVLIPSKKCDTAYCEKLIILVELMRAEAGDFCRPFEISKGGNVLHTMIELSCPPVAIAYVLQKTHSYAKERNSMGRTPLAVAASRNAPKETIRTLLNPLLGLSAAASIADLSGRLPLHLAVENGMDFDDGIDVLLGAEPRALESRDEKERIYPFMIAASSEGGTVNCIFSLLRSFPSVVAPF